MSAELWVLYGIDCHKTGKMHQRGEPLPEGRYHMVVACILLNEENELLIQQRQSAKTWPNLWDICAATGSALAGENPQIAMHRELKEELGIDMDFSNCRPYVTVYGSDYFTHYFVMRTRVSVNDLILQKEEVQAAQFVNKEMLIQLNQAGLCIPYFLLMDHVFELSHARGMQLNNGLAFGKPQVRQMESSEVAKTLDLFKNTIRKINSRDYTPKQIEAWINPERTLESWEQSFTGKQAMVAILNGQLIGFADMDPYGYLDRLYVDANFNGFGAGRALVEALENWAISQQIRCIETHASITAKPFFQHLGYQIVKKQTVICSQVPMNHFVMKKEL